MIGARQFQDYLNFLIEAGSKSDDVVDVPSDYPVHLRAGADYADLIARPGWKRLLDDMEARANQALGLLRQCESNDPVIVKALRDRWREAEDSLKFIQIRAAEAVSRRKEIIKDLGEMFGGIDNDDSPETQRIVEFMNQGQGRGPITFNNEDEEE